MMMSDCDGEVDIMAGDLDCELVRCTPGRKAHVHPFCVRNEKHIFIRVPVFRSEFSGDFQHFRDTSKTETAVSEARF
jgi:hypothetical protein